MGWKDAPLVDDWRSAPTVDESPRQRSPWDEAKRQVGLLGRSALDTAAGLPLAALEGGAGVANLMRRGSDAVSDPAGNFSFRTEWNQGLDATGLPRPETPVEKVTDLATQVTLGGKYIPSPQMGPGVPANFARAADPRAATLAAGQKAGFVVPPSTTNPTILNRTLEGIAGKLTTAQLASAKNQAGFNTAGKQALNLSDDAPLTATAIDAVRREAGAPYEAIRGAGMMQVDDAFLKELDAITAAHSNPARSFPLTPQSPVVARINALRTGADDQPLQQFDAGDAVDQIRLLRDEASKAYAGGDKSLGKALKDAAGALEGAIERNLAKMGEPAQKLLADFRAAREMIAKTYSVEKAFNPSTGNVSGTKLAQQLTKGKPLSGELRTAAQFAQAFPKASREFNESLPGISPLDFYATGGAAALTREPWYLLYPFARQMVRQGLLSPAGQSLATPRGPMNIPTQPTVGATGGLLGW